MTTTIEGIVGEKKGTLIKYNEVFKKLNIPEKYFIDDISGRGVLVSVHLTTIEELKSGEIIPSEIRTLRTEHLTIKLPRNDFNKKLGLKYRRFNIETFFKEKINFLRIYSPREELQHYLDKDSERVYFWISDEDMVDWNRKWFVEMPSADKVRK